LSLDPDIPGLTPARAPGVSNNPVVGSAGSAIADDDDCVVNGAAARSLIGKDSSGVALEVGASGSDGDGLRGVVNCVDDCSLGSGDLVNIVGIVVASGVFASWNAACAANVWVVGLTIVVIVIVVVPAVEVPSTVATAISIGLRARHVLLSGHGHQ